MDLSAKLLWIQLKTTTTRRGGEYETVYDIRLLPELDAQVASLGEAGDSSQSERWSPMFIVDDPAQLAQFNAEVTGTFWLLCDTRPVQLAALLQSHIPADMPHGLFLTHGMASVVLLLEAPHPQVDPGSLFAKRGSLFAIERLTTTGGRVTSRAVLRNGEECSTPPRQSPGKALCPTHLPQTIFRQMQDNDLVLKHIVQLCGKYRPRFLQGVDDLLVRTRRLVDNLCRTAEQASSGDSNAWRTMQHDAYSLTHLNSMLAYLQSQGLNGYPPVLEHHGLLPTLSLFGVATAYEALWVITHFIEEGFSRFDILSEMQSHYFADRSADYHHDVFKPELNDMRPRTIEAPRKAPGHVNLFSGRLGFHSSSWAVAAPVDVLHEASAPGWNLLTLSHELLHVHVQTLLEFVLSPNEEKENGVTQDELYVKMDHLARAEAAETDLVIIDRIRQKIARYILDSAGCRRHDSDSLSQLPRSAGMMHGNITEPAQLGDAFVFCKARLSEYIVHVLDFYYFYWGDVNCWLALILKSWASIPSVYADIGHYIMRCLLTLSTREMEPDTETVLVKPLSFEDSLEVFTTGIKGLAESGDCAHLVSTIQDFLSKPDERERLRQEFSRAKGVVWTTLMYFYCRPLRMYFEVGTDVPGGILDGGAVCPEFEFGAVQERMPVSPIAFLSKYLRSDYVQPDECQEIPFEAASVWLFSWIASCGLAEGGQNASGE